MHVKPDNPILDYRGAVSLRGALGPTPRTPPGERPGRRALPQAPGRSIELFLLETRNASGSLAVDERAFNRESHLALRWESGSPATAHTLLLEAGMRPDGGGYTPHHGAAGSTVLYFTAPSGIRPSRGLPNRLELIADGRRDAVLARHLKAVVEPVPAGPHAMN